MANKIGIVLAVDGEKEFSTAMQNASKYVKQMQTALKASESEFEGQANTIAALTAKQQALTNVQDAYQKKLDAAKAGLQHANENYNKQGARLEELKRALKEATEAQERMNREGADSQAVEKQAKEVENLTKAVDKQTLEQEKSVGKIADWNAKVIQSEADLKKNNKALEQNEKYLKEARQAEDGCAKSIDKMGKEVKETTQELDEAGKKTSTFGDMLKANLTGDVIIGAIKKIGEGLKEAAKYVVEVGSAFESSMSKVQALSGASASEMEEMSAKAQALGASTRFSASEVADAFSYMSLAGWDTKSMLEGIDGVVQLAAASEMDLAAASDMVTDYLSAFNMEASEAAHMADMLAYAQANSNTTAAQLGEAYGNCAASLNAAGQDIETVTSMLEGMANQGLKGSQAGTALNAIMAQITQKMKDGAIQIGETSVAVADQNGNFRDLTDIMKDVEAATEGMGTQQRSAALAAVFNRTALSGVNLILNEGVGKIEAYETALRNCDGAAAEMAGTMQDNLKGDITTFQSALEGLGIAVYDYIDGPVRSVVQGVTEIIQNITTAISPQKDAFDSLIDDAAKANTELEKSIEQSKGIVDNAEAEAANMDALGRQLIALNGIEEKSALQKQNLKAIVDELGKSVPEVAAAYDEEAGKVRLSDQAIQNLIKNTKELMMLQAQQAAGQEIINHLVDAEVSLEQAKAQRDAYQERIDMLKEEQGLLIDLNAAWLEGNVDDDRWKTEQIEFWTEKLNEGKITLDEFNTLTTSVGVGSFEQRMSDSEASISGFTNKVNEADATIGELSTTVEEANKEYDSYQDAAAKVGERLNGTTDAAEKNRKKIEELTKEFENAKTEEEAGRIERLIQKYQEEAEAAGYAAIDTKDSGKAISDAGAAADEASDDMDGLSESTEKAAEQAKKVGEAYQKAFDGMLEAYTSLKEDFKKSVETDFLADTFDGGVDKTIEEFLKNSDAQIKGLQDYAKNLETVRDHVGKEIAPEFLAYLESMGTDGANILAHIAATFEQDNGAEILQQWQDNFFEKLHLEDQLSTILANDKIALEGGLKELGSSATDWSILEQAFEGAKAAVEAGGGEITQAEIDAFDDAVKTAKEYGVKIPDNLADGIRDGSVTIEGATERLNAAIQGQFDALKEIAENNGIKIPEEITNGIAEGGDAAVEAVNQLLQLLADSDIDTDSMKEKAKEQTDSYTETIREGKEDAKAAAEEVADAAAEGVSGKEEDFRAAGEASGKAYLDGFQDSVGGSGEAGSALTEALLSSLKSAAEQAESFGSDLAAKYAAAIGAYDAGSAGEKLAKSGSDAMRNQTGAYGNAGQSAGNAFSDGLRNSAGIAGNAGSTVGNAAIQGVSSGSGGAYSIGLNIAYGVASGISAGASAAISAASSMASSALQAAKNALDIHSPSRKFRKDVGQQIATGMAFGIRDKASLASRQAALMSEKVYQAASKWIKKYKSSQNVSIDDEKYYWQQVTKHVKEGTTAYKNAVKQLQTVSAVAKNGVASALYNSGFSANQSLALNKKISANFGVSRTKITGSGKNQKTEAKTDAEYYSEILKAAQTYYNNLNIIQDRSAKQDLAYWQNVQKSLKKGTQAWYDAQKEINTASANILQEELSNIEQIRSRGQMTSAQEAKYWRKQISEAKKGSEEYWTYFEKLLSAKSQYVEDQRSRGLMSAAQEAKYWRKQIAEVKEGSEEYWTYYQNLRNAQKQYVEDQRSRGLMSAAQEISYWKKRLKEVKKGSEEYYTYLSYINEARDNYVTDQKERGLMSNTQEVRYWKNLADSAKQGSEDYWKYYIKYQTAFKNLNSSKFGNSGTLLSNLQTYYKMSSRQLAQYWNLVRSMFASGTEERIEADKKYLDSKQDFYNELKNLDENYEKDLSDINDKLSGDIKDLMQTYEESVRSTRESIISATGSLFEFFDHEGEESMDTLLDNMQSHINALEVYEDAMDRLRRRGGVTDEVIQYFEDQGIQSAATLQTLARSSDEQWSAWLQMFNQTQAMADREAKKENEDLLADTKEQIQQLIVDADKDIRALYDEYRKARTAAEKEWGESELDTIKKIVDKLGDASEESMSESLLRIGQMLDEASIEESARDAAGRFNSGIENTLKDLPDITRYIGEKSLEGLLSGLRQDNGMIEQVAGDIINDLENAFRRSADIHSPSRRFEDSIGEQITAGVGAGMMNGLPDAISDAQRMIDEITDAARKQMDGIADIGSSMNQALSDNAFNQVVSISNDSFAANLDPVMRKMDDLISRIESLEVTIDGDTMVGALQPKLSYESAIVSSRMTRGRL